MKTLIVAFNEFYPDNKFRYYTMDKEGDVRELKRKPRGRYVKVLEIGDAEYNQWNAHRAKRVYSSPFLVKEAP